MNGPIMFKKILIDIPVYTSLLSTYYSQHN